MLNTQVEKLTKENEDLEECLIKKDKEIQTLKIELSKTHEIMKKWNESASKVDNMNSSTKGPHDHSGLCFVDGLGTSSKTTFVRDSTQIKDKGKSALHITEHVETSGKILGPTPNKYGMKRFVPICHFL